MQHATRACCPDGALERVNLGSIHLMQHATRACCPDGALKRVILDSIHLMQHATRACCPDGALERVNLGSIHLSPRWGFRTGKSWFYTPHAACHTRMLPRWGFRTGKSWFLYTSCSMPHAHAAPMGLQNRVNLSIHLMQHATRACCPDGPLERVNLGSIHLMQHATRACCPDGALERVNLGFYTPHAACHNG